MLAPGVNARDTAERETPARLATSAAVTKAPRSTCSLTACLSCTRVHRILCLFARVCNTMISREPSAISESLPDSRPPAVGGATRSIQREVATHPLPAPAVQRRSLDATAFDRIVAA